jgi:hypothetical protein
MLGKNMSFGAAGGLFWAWKVYSFWGNSRNGKGKRPYFTMISKLQIFLVCEKEKGFDFPYNRTSVVSSNNVLA